MFARALWRVCFENGCGAHDFVLLLTRADTVEMPVFPATLRLQARARVAVIVDDVFGEGVCVFGGRGWGG